MLGVGGCGVTGDEAEMAVFQREGLQWDVVRVCVGRCEVSPHRWSKTRGGEEQESGPEGPSAIKAWWQEHRGMSSGGVEQKDVLLCQGTSSKPAFSLRLCGVVLGDSEGAEAVCESIPKVWTAASRGEVIAGRFTLFTCSCILLSSWCWGRQG